MLTGAQQAATYNARRRSRSRRFAQALTVHRSGLTVVGMDEVATAAAADFVQDEQGIGPWVALTSGVTDATPLTGNGVVSDGLVTWQFWSGNLLSMPKTP